MLLLKPRRGETVAAPVPTPEMTPVRTLEVLKTPGITEATPPALPVNFLATLRTPAPVAAPALVPATGTNFQRVLVVAAVPTAAPTS